VVDELEEEMEDEALGGPRASTERRRAKEEEEKSERREAEREERRKASSRPLKGSNLGAETRDVLMAAVRATGPEQELLLGAYQGKLAEIEAEAEVYRLVRNIENKDEDKDEDGDEEDEEQGGGRARTEENKNPRRAC